MIFNCICAARNAYIDHVCVQTVCTWLCHFPGITKFCFLLFFPENLSQKAARMSFWPPGIYLLLAAFLWFVCSVLFVTFAFSGNTFRISYVNTWPKLRESVCSSRPLKRWNVCAAKPPCDLQDGASCGFPTLISTSTPSYHRSTSQSQHWDSSLSVWWSS